MIAKRSFGASGVEASEIGFGAWTLGLDWWGEVSPPDARSLVERAIELGVTFFDTADTYGAGLGEERLGAALAGRRDEVTIATKFGYVIDARPGGHSEKPQRWDPEFIRAACEASLRRLGTDVIDLYELHNPRMPQIYDDAIFSTLEELKASGKIRAYGVALGPAIGWEAEGVQALRTRRIDALQTVYNLLEQEPGNAFGAEAGEATGLIARVPHASDALSGRFTPDTVFPASDHRSFRKREWLLRALRKVERLDFLCETRTIGQAAVAWILAQPGITTVLPTVTTVEQLEEFAAAASLTLSDQEVARVRDLYERDFDLPPPSADEQIELRATTA